MFQMLHLFSDVRCNCVHLDVLKLDQVLHLHPRLSAVSPWCQGGKAEAVPTSVVGPHVLAGGHHKRGVGEQARGRGTGSSGAGVQTGS
jgi:hypothetical protein